MPYKNIVLQFTFVHRYAVNFLSRTTHNNYAVKSSIAVLRLSFDKIYVV